MEGGREGGRECVPDRAHNPIGHCRRTERAYPSLSPKALKSLEKRRSLPRRVLRGASRCRKSICEGGREGGKEGEREGT